MAWRTYKCGCTSDRLQLCSEAQNIIDEMNDAFEKLDAYRQRNEQIPPEVRERHEKAQQAYRNHNTEQDRIYREEH